MAKGSRWVTEKSRAARPKHPAPLAGDTATERQGMPATLPQPPELHEPLTTGSATCRPRAREQGRVTDGAGHVKPAGRGFDDPALSSGTAWAVTLWPRGIPSETLATLPSPQKGNRAAASTSKQHGHAQERCPVTSTQGQVARQRRRPARDLHTSAPGTGERQDLPEATRRRWVSSYLPPTR